MEEKKGMGPGMGMEMMKQMMEGMGGGGMPPMMEK
jgi:hypothetical protein